MSFLFHEIIYRPLLNLSIFLYSTIGFADFGVTIILVTLIVRLVMLPFSLRAARSQKAIAAIGPEVEAIRKQYKDDMNAQSEAVLKLYRERGINPLGGCLPLLVQLPLLFGLYRVFLHAFDGDTLNLLYGFLSRPDTINGVAFGFVNISTPNPFFAITAGILQFFQARLSLGNQPQTQQSAAMGKQMMYALPLIIIVIGWNLPAGLALYWIATTLFGIGEQLYLRSR